MGPSNAEGIAEATCFVDRTHECSVSQQFHLAQEAPVPWQVPVELKCDAKDLSAAGKHDQVVSKDGCADS